MTGTVKRIHYFQHVPYEGLGSIGTWLEGTAVTLTRTRFFLEEQPPSPSTFDMLIVLGGPMSVNDEHELRWLAAEKRVIRDAIEAGKKVLGICLGAQLIAAALGERVYPHRHREIGWFPIRATSKAQASPFPLPPVTDAFHWHADTFDLPGSAVHLARSDACEHQAFHIGDNVLGLQFHLEITPQIAEAFVGNSGDSLESSAWVQPRAALLAAAPERYRAANRLMRDLLARITGMRPVASAARAR